MIKFLRRKRRPVDDEEWLRFQASLNERRLDWERAGRRVLELMPALRRPSLTRGEVLALADGWASVWPSSEYQAARNAAFSADRDGGDGGRERAIPNYAWDVARDRARASGEWRSDVLNHACHAIKDAAHGRGHADRIAPAFVATLERLWHEVVEDDATRPADLVLGPPTSPPHPDLIGSFVARCVSRGWDEEYARAMWESPASDVDRRLRRLAYDAALRRCRKATWAGGRDTLARNIARAATAVPTPGGCSPGMLEMWVDEFHNDVARTAEAVVARDLIDRDDFAILTETWRSHFGSLG